MGIFSRGKDKCDLDEKRQDRDRETHMIVRQFIRVESLLNGRTPYFFVRDHRCTYRFDVFRARGLHCKVNKGDSHRQAPPQKKKENK